MEHLSRILTVSAAYAILFWFSGVVMSSASFGDGVNSATFASLIFLPHSVRVIAAWLYGWRSLFYLGPATYAVHFWRFADQEMSLSLLIMPLFGIACVAATFEIVAFFGADLRAKAGFVAPWRSILLVGALASVINAIGTNIIVGNSLDTAFQYLAGDIGGMLTAFFALMLMFRYMRRLGY